MLSKVGRGLLGIPVDVHIRTVWTIVARVKPRATSRAAQALKLAAAVLRTSQSALGAYYRRLCARMDKPKAVTAAAHKLARVVYAMLTKGEEYTDRGQAYYEERYRQRVVANLNRPAQQLGLQVVPITQPA